ncbi:MAG TPA: hypothetical protein VLK33_07580, partial [Terriglobales bacterium]|nr:hypothetical protein [Terriglobales bacterium]
VAAGAAAILAVTLWVHGSSPSALKAASKDSTVQTAAPAIQVVQKTGPVAGTKVLAKSNPEDNFQEVVVRHFDQPVPPAASKDGVKRRVVVD